MSTSTTTSSSTEGVPENKAGSSTLPVSPLDQTDILAYIHKYSSYDAEKLEDLGTLLQRKRIYGSTTVSILVAELLETLLALPYTNLTVYDILILLSQIGEYLLSSALSLSSTDSSIYGSTWIIIGVIRRASYLIQETTMKRNALLFTGGSTLQRAGSNPNKSPIVGRSSSSMSSVSSTLNRSQSNFLSYKNTNSSMISTSSILDSLRTKLTELIDKDKNNSSSVVPSLSLSSSISASVPKPTMDNTSSSSSLPVLPSLRTLFLDPSAASIAAYSRFATITWTKVLASSILDGIGEVTGECSNVSSSLQETVVDHIRPGESILLAGGYSRTVLNYIQEASKKRMFEVFICEGNNIHNLRGQEMAIQLTMVPETSAATASKGTVPPTTLVPESTVYSILPRISKVFVSSPAVFGSTGDCICTSGTLGILLAASKASKPILVINSTMKILPISYTDLPGYNSQGNKQNILSYLEHNELLSSNNSKDNSTNTTVDIYVPLWDYIPSKFITYYITTSGVHLPNQIPRIANELYGTHY